MKIMVRILMVGLFCFFVVNTVMAEELSVTVVDDSWDAAFRDHLTFNLEATSEAEVVEAFLFYKVVGQLATSRNEAEFTPGTSIKAEFSLDQTLPVNYMPPGAEVEYWWKLVDAEDNEFKTERQRLFYTDERFSWQQLQNERLTLSWYEGDEAFGTALFDRANLALDTLESDVGVAIENPVKIFIYGDHDDLLSSLSTSAQEWTGGVAFTEFGVVVIGINPVQLEWGLSAMTHEMTHLVIHQATDNPYGDLPRWLDEGIAVYNEDKEQLVSDFKPLLDEAIAKNKVMTLRTLSSPFPSDPIMANLAYGQSGEVVRFIINHHGPEAMAELLDIFSEGALYDEALEQALKVDTDTLDNQWRVSVGLEPLAGVEVVPPPIPNKPETEAASTDTKSNTQAEERVGSETTQAGEAASNSPADQPAPPIEEAAGLLACLTGLIAMLFLFMATGGRL